MRSFELKIFALLVFVFWAGPTAHAESAKMFKLTANGDLSKVKGYNWSNRWTQIVPFSARGENLLLFYDRDRGLAKLFSYNEAGGLYRKKSYSGWSKDWDHVIAGQFGEANMIFYNRANGLLKGFRISATGSMSLQFEQTIENPQRYRRNSDGSYRVQDHPSWSLPGGGPGWDIVTPGHWSWVNGRTVPGLLFYNRTEGLVSFKRYDEAEERFVLVRHIPAAWRNWENSWDEIKAADFDGDQVDDLVLYDQDGGKLKVVYMNEDYSSDRHLLLKDRDGVFAGRTHFPQLVIGNFGGGRLKKDILLYQQDKCPDGQDCIVHEHGRGLLWIDNGRGGWDPKPKVYSNWRDDWTHVVPVEAKPTYYGSTGLLFYRNQVKLKLVLWRVEETNVIRPRTGASGKFVPPQGSAWSPGEEAQLDAWAQAARNTFKAAGIDFSYSLRHYNSSVWDNELKDWNEDIDLNNPCGRRRGTELFQDWVSAQNLPDDTIYAFVVPGTGTGCSWKDKNHLLVGGGNSLGNPKHLGHELGHYFGLPHTNVGQALDPDLDYIKPACKIPPSGSGSYSQCVSAIAAKLAEKKDELGRDVRFADLDNDLGWRGIRVYDTPPVLNKVVTQHLRENTFAAHPSGGSTSGASGQRTFDPIGNCKPGARYTFSYPFNVPRTSQSVIEMYQESHNVLNYTNCDGLFRISKDQARVIRQGLFRTDGDYGWRRGLVGN